MKTHKMTIHFACLEEYKWLVLSETAVQFWDGGGAQETFSY